jgi:hypothetical protein
MVGTNGTHSEYDRYNMLMTSERRNPFEGRRGNWRVIYQSVQIID